jgi:hypothetical protein
MSEEIRAELARIAPEDPRRSAWELRVLWRQEALEAAASEYLAACGRPEGATMADVVRLAAKTFDACAATQVVMVNTPELAIRADEYLSALLPIVSERYGTGHPLATESFRLMLRAKLAERRAHWAATAYGLARDSALRAIDGAEEPVSGESHAAAPPASPSGEEILDEMDDESLREAIVAALETGNRQGAVDLKIRLERLQSSKEFCKRAFGSHGNCEEDTKRKALSLWINVKPGETDPKKKPPKWASSRLEDYLRRR